MSRPILFGETVVQLPSARIAARDVSVLCEASDLLARAKLIRDEAAAASEAACAKGYEDGRKAARDEMAQAMGEALKELTERFSAENTRRNEELGRAAIEVVAQLIGQRDPIETVTGLAAQTLARLGVGETGCVVELAPNIAGPVAERLLKEGHTAKVVENEGLSAYGCRVRTQDGVIVADLETQLQTLRERWGLDQNEAPLAAPDQAEAGPER
ncbi:MAG: FliH/SctL family protein [Pseudomonadota bacterium]